jgi:NADH-quinone oxidoreductase subunit M
LKKFGLYGLLRLALPLLPEGARQWSGILLVLLLANIIYIGLVTIAQRRLDWMLGYSSVMHMGYIFLGIASANILGTTGAAILMFAHGLSIALLFGITGEIRKRVLSLDFDAMGGLAKAMPLAAFAFGLGVFAAIGLPGFANFAAEIMVVFGAFRNGFDYQHFHIFQWATLLALWGVVISAVYMLRAYRRTFFGNSAKSELVITDIDSGFRVPIALLVAVSLLLGFFPQIVVNLPVPTFRNYFSAAQ